MIAVHLFTDQNKSTHNISLLGTYNFSHLFIDQNKSTNRSLGAHNILNSPKMYYILMRITRHYITKKSTIYTI